MNHIEFIFGFPNQNSLKGFQKLKWQFLSEPLQFFSFPQRTLPIARLMNRTDTLRTISDVILKPFFSTPDAAILTHQPVNGVCHDDVFFQYKKYNNTYVYKAERSTVWLKIDGSLKIGAVNLQNNKPIEWLMTKLHKIALLTGCSQIVFMTQKNSSLFKALSKISNSRDALPIGFYPLNQKHYNFSNVTFEYCDIDIF
jgi:hypothetical protein